jgi:protein SCO1/2
MKIPQQAKTPLIATGLAAAVLATGGLFAWLGAPDPVSREVQSNRALIGGPFALTDQNGQRRTSDSFRGRYMLIYFGFTFCPDICPTELATMTQGLMAFEAQNPALAARIQPIFITVDPDRDTPDVLKTYVANFHPRFVGLTGTPADIEAVKAAYRVFAQKVDPQANPQNYLVDHSSLIYLMNPQGEYVTHFGMGTAPDEMATRLADVVRG